MSMSMEGRAPQPLTGDSIGQLAPAGETAGHTHTQHDRKDVSFTMVVYMN